MYLGKMVELSDSDELYKNPLHPYTQALLSSLPVPDIHHEKDRVLLEGEIPSPDDPPSGCPFHTRCPIAQDYCKHEMPAFREITKGHYVACHEV